MPLSLPNRGASIALTTAGSCAVLVFCYRHLKRDRWALVRLHNWGSIRFVYKSCAIYDLARRIDKAYASLPEPIDAMTVVEGGDQMLKDIFAQVPDTFQSKPSNQTQITSLMRKVADLVTSVRGSGATPLILDLGAGKALFTRALYESLGRTVAAVAMDVRGTKAGDFFFDPPPDDDGDDKTRDRPFTRIVADVHRLSARTIGPALTEGKGGGVICITKHLCGGATDASIKALCMSPLDTYVGACCLAPCCHQKTRRPQYCNLPYLESQGFCTTHIGMRGGVQDADFRTFGMLISMSKTDDLKDWEYKKSTMLWLLGTCRAQELGVKVRRILEEGRIQYLTARGFDAHLVRYCEDTVTYDNLAIIATRVKKT